MNPKLHNELEPVLTVAFPNLNIVLLLTKVFLYKTHQYMKKMKKKLKICSDIWAREVRLSKGKVTLKISTISMQFETTIF